MEWSSFRAIIVFQISYLKNNELSFFRFALVCVGSVSLFPYVIDSYYLYGFVIGVFSSAHWF